MKHNLEQHGFLIFFISTLIVSQLRWAENYNYNDIAQRLAASILVGVMLNVGLKKWLDRLTEQIKNTNENEQLYFVCVFAIFRYIFAIV